MCLIVESRASVYCEDESERKSMLLMFAKGEDISERVICGQLGGWLLGCSIRSLEGSEGEYECEYVY